MKNGFYPRAIIIALLITLSFNSFARKFYLSSSTGNDSYTLAQAQNPATPWKTLIKLESIGNTANAILPGDTFAFKRGDVFDNGRDNFGSFKWWAIAGYHCPSGTADHPIVFTNYGTGELPNFLFPRGANGGDPATKGNARHVLTFNGVGYIVFDGLQFNDTRFSYTDKVSTAYTSAGLLLGEYGGGECNHMVVKNCNFSRIGYAILSAGSYFDIGYNTCTNMKSVGDTSGMTDIGADFMVPYGPHYRIHHNYIKGNWFYTSGTGGGKGGGTFEVCDNFDSSSIMYNTIIDCDGVIEVGSIFDHTVGSNEDTVAYNIMINNGGVSYIHQADAFGGFNSNWHFWNNIMIENENSRFSGNGFGRDIYGDGQSFAQFPTWGGNYGYAAVTGMPRNTSANSPANCCNYTGLRTFQYTSDNGVPGGVLYDIRNNIVWNTTHTQILYDTLSWKSIKHKNNIFRLGGSYMGGSTLGGELGAGDRLITNQPFDFFFHSLK